jgi:hypothetical protein
LSWVSDTGGYVSATRELDQTSIRVDVGFGLFRRRRFDRGLRRDEVYLGRIVGIHILRKQAIGRDDGRYSSRAPQTERVVENTLDLSPPGYRDWRQGDSGSAWRILATQLADGKPTPSGPIGLPLESQLVGPFPYDFTATDVPVRFVGQGVIADRLLSRPATFNVPARDELERALKHFKHEKDRSGGKGSHEKWTGPDERAFILPKRDPVSGHVFRTFLQHVGIAVRPQL